MKVWELKEKLLTWPDDWEVTLKEVASDRYGDTIGLVVNDDTRCPLMKEYFGGEMPRW